MQSSSGTTTNSNTTLNSNCSVDQWYYRIDYMVRELERKDGSEYSQLFTLLNILLRATESIPITSVNREDPHFLSIWIMYIKLCQRLDDKSEDELRSFFKFLRSSRVGIRCSLFYIEWAGFEQSKGKASKAESILSNGIEAGAEPREDLIDALSKLKSGYSVSMPLFTPLCGNKENRGTNNTLSETTSKFNNNIDNGGFTTNTTFNTSSIQPAITTCINNVSFTSTNTTTTTTTSSSSSMDENKSILETNTPVIRSTSRSSGFIPRLGIRRFGLGGSAARRRADDEEEEEEEILNLQIDDNNDSADPDPISPVMYENVLPPSSPKKEPVIVNSPSFNINIEKKNKNDGSENQVVEKKVIHVIEKEVEKKVEKQVEKKVQKVEAKFIDKKFEAEKFMDDEIKDDRQERNSSKVVTSSSKKVSFEEPVEVKTVNPFLNQEFQINGNTFYRLQLIGRGGSSKVYRVLSASGEIYALKSVRIDPESADESILQGYRNEIDLLQKFRKHPYVVNMVDYEIINEERILVLMELGEIDLGNLIQSYRKRPNYASFVDFCWHNILLAVQSIHLENIVHCDLKPANFLLVRGVWKLIDFGISKTIQQDHTSVLRENQVGTVSYMSPEALKGNSNVNSSYLKINRASDVWSLGCILYEMVYGKSPFSIFPTLIARVTKIIDQSYEIPFPSNPPENSIALKARYDPILRLCLERNVKNRASIDQLLGEITNH